MSFTSISPREFFLGPNTNTASHLGPGTYDYLPVGDNTALLKKRLQSRNAGGFNSHEIKTSASKNDLSTALKFSEKVALTVNIK